MALQGFVIVVTDGEHKLRTEVQLRSPSREQAEEAFEQWVAEGVMTLDDLGLTFNAEPVEAH